MKSGCLYERGNHSSIEKLTFARFSLEALTLRRLDQKTGPVIDAVITRRERQTAFTGNAAMPPNGWNPQGERSRMRGSWAKERSEPASL